MIAVSADDWSKGFLHSLHFNSNGISNFLISSWVSSVLENSAGIVISNPSMFEVMFEI